jgi:hypothetical protein
MQALNIKVEPVQINIKKSFLCKRKISIARSYENDTSLQNIFKRIDSYIRSPDKIVLKNDRSSTVFKIGADNRFDIVIRRDNYVSILKYLKRVIRKSRSRKIWENGQLMKYFGLKTINPIALIEDYRFFVRTGSYVVYEYIDGMTLRAYFRNPDISDTDKNIIASKLVQDIYKWHSLGITHGDPKASNILIREDEIYLIDAEDIKIPKSRWSKIHAITRDKYIILPHWQKYPEQREDWIRKFVLDHCLAKRYFGRCLVKKFWKDEYSILSLSFSKRIDAGSLLASAIAHNSLYRWLNIFSNRKGSYLLPKNRSFRCIFSRRAFLFAQSIEAYFRKKRVPKRGVFSITVALRICGFILPEIIDGGIFRGVEYVIFAPDTGRSVHSVWKEVKNNSSIKDQFILKLAEETGRLHAMGFEGVIQSLNSIFVKTVNDSFVIGFKLNSNVRYHPGRRCEYLKKDVKVIETEFLTQIPVGGSALFWDKYNEVVS